MSRQSWNKKFHVTFDAKPGFNLVTVALTEKKGKELTHEY